MKRVIVVGGGSISAAVAAKLLTLNCVVLIPGRAPTSIKKFAPALVEHTFDLKPAMQINDQAWYRRQTNGKPARY